MQDIVARIRDLQNQLQMLGYHAHQIHNIMQDIAGNSPIETLPPAEQAEVLHNLEEYINFARKCLRKNN